MKRKYVVLFVLCAAFGSAAAPCVRAQAPGLSTTTVTLPGGEVLTAELALTPEEKERGLMYRTELAPRSGMLFVFDAEDVLPFWMKNTWIDLDILYLDREGRITKIFNRVPRSTPETPDSQVARIHGVGQYVLELSAGSARRFKLKKGQKLKFEIGKKKLREARAREKN
jgi:uncharacterized membrane protein (UPF0127 family)